MYHIVSFVDTEEVEIVPAVWVKGGVCLWPPYKSEGVQRATKSQEQPHENWTPYNIKVLYTTTLLHDLLIKQEIIIEQQRNLIRMVQDLKTTSARENTAACEDTIACDMNQRHLPIEDLPSLMALENDLRSSPDKRKKLVLELGLIGGADIKDTVWRILKQTIKNDLAKTVTWHGVNGKTGFRSLQLKNVVTEAVRRNPVCSQATEMEVERVIRRWFHLACDREEEKKSGKCIRTKQNVMDTPPHWRVCQKVTLETAVLDLLLVSFFSS
ncbi:uncharacterized protein LOC119264657 [Pygocentrus nattereri]|uniref:uncharacterized protein LOC119264657 n=1 Tax=Pygocentrus nattereri TaxID=42514 RepID=UPI0018910DC9|nr:uncharacterized protein LOC119264657 [Pygocentrus nattereri]